MSANNWAVCPMCKRNNKKKEDSVLADIESQYGKIPSSEYLAKVISAKKNAVINNELSLREDWELGVRDDGTFSVVYFCSCEVCGMEWQYKKEVGIFDETNDADRDGNGRNPNMYAHSR